MSQRWDTLKRTGNKERILNLQRGSCGYFPLSPSDLPSSHSLPVAGWHLPFSFLVSLSALCFLVSPFSMPLITTILYKNKQTKHMQSENSGMQFSWCSSLNSVESCSANSFNRVPAVHLSSFMSSIQLLQVMK